MPIEPGDFGPELVTPAAVQGWLDWLGRKRSPRTVPDVAPPPREPPRPERPRPTAAQVGAGAPRILPKASIFATVVLALAVWAASGFYRVQPDQVGLVLRYGELVQSTGPGLNYHWLHKLVAALGEGGIKTVKR